MSILIAFYVFAVQFFAFSIKGLIGFGNPVISSPLLSMVFNNSLITPANIFMDAPANTYIAIKNRQHFSIKKILPLAGLVLLGNIVGVMFLKYSTAWVIKVILGILLIIIGIEMLTRKNAQPAKYNPLIGGTIAFISGITAGLFGICMLFVAYIQRTSKENNEFTGSICFVLALENIFRIILYFFMGMYTIPVMNLVLTALPAGILGIICGIKLQKHLDEKKVKFFAILMFLLSGVSIFLKALILKS